MCSIKEKKIKVLHILVCLGDGGVEGLLLKWYKKIPSFIRFDFLVLNKGILDDYFVKNGSYVHYLPRNIAYKPWLHSCYIEELVSKYRYEIVHFHRFAFGGLIMRAMKKCNVPGRIVHSRSTIFQEKSAIKRILYVPFHMFINRYFLIRYATHILACSNEAGIFLMGPLWAVSHKCIYLPKGVSISEFKSLIGNSTREILCNRHRIPLDAIVIGHFGRMEPVKNHKHLLDVFAVLYRRSSKYWLFLGGEGSLQNEIMNYAGKLGVSDRVCMPGFCENAPELYANLFDAFCLTSFAEGFPNVLIEAVLSGLFCVCSSNITKDITNSLSDRIYTLSLKANIGQWADMIDFAVEQKKSFDDGVIYIKRSKFTIDNQVSTLINIYNNSFL